MRAEEHEDENSGRLTSDKRFVVAPLDAPRRRGG